MTNGRDSGRSGSDVSAQETDEQSHVYVSANSPSSIDPTRIRRIKALTCTQPLHSLQTNRGRRGWENFDFYDLGLAAIDAVVDKMGFDSGIGREALETILVGDAKRFAAGVSEVELRAVLTELIETLIRPNIGEYTSATDEIRRRFDFTLLSEHEDAETSAVSSASPTMGRASISGSLSR